MIRKASARRHEEIDERLARFRLAQGLDPFPPPSILPAEETEAQRRVFDVVDSLVSEAFRLAGRE